VAIAAAPHWIDRSQRHTGRQWRISLSHSDLLITTWRKERRRRPCNLLPPQRSPRSPILPGCTGCCDHVACHNGGSLMLASRVARIIYSSSSSVYGDTPVLPKTETAEPLPRSPYAASKLAGEQYVLAFARAGLIEGVALRYFNVFGPRQSPHSAYAAVIPRFF